MQKIKKTNEALHEKKYISNINQQKRDLFHEFYSSPQFWRVSIIKMHIDLGNNAGSLEPQV